MALYFLDEKAMGNPFGFFIGSRISRCAVEDREIRQVRRDIDEIDRRFLNLLNQRANLAVKIEKPE